MARSPFQQIAADYFELKGHHYLVTADRLSGWLDITHADRHNRGAKGLIAALRRLFATYGVPEELASDGGTEFTAAETQQFLHDWKVSHRVSSAHHPQSNGRAEVVVKTAKRYLPENISPSGSLDNDAVVRAVLAHKTHLTTRAGCPLRKW